VEAFLTTVHPWLGYLVSVVLLVAASIAFSRAKDGREFDASGFVLVVVALDVQVVIGLASYALRGSWDATALVAYVHPLLGMAALIAAHVGLRRAKREPMAAASYRLVGRGLLTAFVLIVAAIGVASMA
jgi:heme A synthase